jgi:hypothetical protein
VFSTANQAPVGVKQLKIMMTLSIKGKLTDVATMGRVGVPSLELFPVHRVAVESVFGILVVRMFASVDRPVRSLLPGVVLDADTEAAEDVAESLVRRLRDRSEKIADESRVSDGGGVDRAGGRKSGCEKDGGDLHDEEEVE